MPELPEVETVCRGLESPLVGRRLSKVTQRRDNLRWPFPDDFAARLEGRTVQRLYRRAKFILADLDDGWVWMNLVRYDGSGTKAVPVKLSRVLPHSFKDYYFLSRKS